MFRRLAGPGCPHAIAGDGIRLAESTYDSTYVGKVTATRNTVVGNGGHGFNLTPTLGAVVGDGGRNRAAGNTLDAMHRGHLLLGR